MPNQHIANWKLQPGSVPARAVELMHFLPDGTALSTSELRKRIDAPAENFAQSLFAPAARGLLKRDRRRNPDGLGNTIFWMAGDQSSKP